MTKERKPCPLSIRGTWKIFSVENKISASQLLLYTHLMVQPWVGKRKKAALEYNMPKGVKEPETLKPLLRKL